jgi:hypothetical protein
MKLFLCSYTTIDKPGGRLATARGMRVNVAGENVAALVTAGYGCCAISVTMTVARCAKHKTQRSGCLSFAVACEK